MSVNLNAIQKLEWKLNFLLSEILNIKEFTNTKPWKSERLNQIHEETLEFMIGQLNLRINDIQNQLKEVAQFGVEDFKSQVFVK